MMSNLTYLVIGFQFFFFICSAGVLGVEKPGSLESTPTSYTTFPGSRTPFSHHRLHINRSTQQPFPLPAAPTLRPLAPGHHRLHINRSPLQPFPLPAAPILRPLAPEHHSHSIDNISRDHLFRLPPFLLPLNSSCSYSHGIRTPFLHHKLHIHWSALQPFPFSSSLSPPYVPWH
jgi:hypothetical protein